MGWSRTRIVNYRVQSDYRFSYSFLNHARHEYVNCLTFFRWIKLFVDMDDSTLFFGRTGDIAIIF